MGDSAARSFAEVQRFRQRWLWQTILGLNVLLLLLLALNQGLWLSLPRGPLFELGRVIGPLLGQVPPAMLLALLVVLNLGALLLLTWYMETYLTAEGIHFRYFPFRPRLKIIRHSEIRALRPVEYRPLDFRGYGVYRIRNMEIYSVRGTLALRLDLQDGRRILLGTQEPGELMDAIEAYQAQRQSQKEIEFKRKK